MDTVFKAWEPQNHTLFCGKYLYTVAYIILREYPPPLREVANKIPSSPADWEEIAGMLSRKFSTSNTKFSRLNARGVI